MSVRCIDAVLNRSQHAGTELLMLVVLADYSDDDGNSYPSVAALARKCRTGQRNANYVLNALQSSGELRVLKNEGPRGTNRYRIMLAKLGSDTLQSGSPLQPAAPLKQRAPLKPNSPTPATQFLKPLQPSADEPSLNRQEPSSAIAKTKRASKAKSEHPLFPEFYAAYPRKVARAAASKAFAALAPDRELQKTMIEAIATQQLAERCAQGEERYVPHPASWINLRRWEDAAPGGSNTVARRPVLNADHVFGADT